MDATHQALLRELPQVAADRILGHAEADHELRGDHPAVTLNRREDRLSAFSRQHAACYSTKMQVFAGIATPLAGKNQRRAVAGLDSVERVECSGLERDGSRARLRLRRLQLAAG